VKIRAPISDIEGFVEQALEEERFKGLLPEPQTYYVKNGKVDKDILLAKLDRIERDVIKTLKWVRAIKK